MSGGTYGGFAPQPERYGGGKRRIEYILDALLQSDQTEIGLDTTPAEFSPTQNPVWIEELATARAISAAWGTNTRGSNEFYPLKTMSMLPRWQTLFGIVPPQNETAPQQRAFLTFKWQALYKDPTPGQIADDLAYLGTTPDGTQTVFVGVTYTTAATGPQYFYHGYPGGNGTEVASVLITNGGSGYGSPPLVTFSAPYEGIITAQGTAVLTGGVVTSVTITSPGAGYNFPATVAFGGGGAAAGTVLMLNPNPYDPNGTTTPGVSLVDWWSATLNLQVNVTQPAGMNSTTYQTLTGNIAQYLDGALPAWMTYSLATSVGFFLDEPNLGISALT